jgi:hypothetical protein
VIPGLIIGTAVILIVVLGVATYRRDRRYQAGLFDWATDRGWTYRQGGGGEWITLLPRGNGRCGVKLQLDGSRDGRPVTVAHYWYQTTHTTTRTDSNGYRRTTESTATHALTVIVVWLAARYPAVGLEDRGLGWGWGLALSRALGREPPNLTGNEQFDRRYRIRTAAPGVSALVTPQVIKAHLANDLPSWGLNGNQLVITWSGRIRVEEVDAKIDQALWITGLLALD